MQRTFSQPASAPARATRLAHGHPIRRALVTPRAPSVQKPPKSQEGDTDLKLFALSFTAFFICIYTLIF